MASFVHNGLSAMASQAETRRILEAIAKLDTNLSVAAASLEIKVANIGTQVMSLSSEMRDKASRSELVATEARLQKELTRVQADVGTDVQGFQQMYESLVAEMRELRDEQAKGLAIQAQNAASLASIDERVKKLEPLHDVWMKMLGARWVVGLLSALGGAGSFAGMAKFFGWLK